MMGAGMILLISGAARWAIGSVYGDSEAQQLITSLANAGLYLGSAIATASATTLALMLALIGLTNRSDSDFDNAVYVRISRVSSLATAALIGSVLLLLLLVLPIGEFENIPEGWYLIFYNILFAMVSLVCATLVATILQLYLTIRRVLVAVTPLDDKIED